LKRNRKAAPAGGRPIPQHTGAAGRGDDAAGVKPAPGVRDARSEAKALRAKREAIKAAARGRREVAFAVMVRAVRNWVSECHPFADRLDLVAADALGGGQVIACFHHYHDAGDHVRGDELALAAPAADVAATLRAMAETAPLGEHGAPD
jgi:hypothetical protein